VANRIAELAIGLAQDLSQDETLRTRDYIRTQLVSSRQSFDEARTRLEEFRKKAQVEALRKDVDSALGQRATLLPLLVEIEAEKARLARAEEQLSTRERISTLTRTIDSDAGLMEAAREKSGGQNLVGLQTKNQEVNQVYDTIDEQVASSRTRLSGLEREKAQLVDVLKLGSNQLALLNTLYEREAELVRVQTEFDLAKNVYTDVATRYEQARLQVAGKTAQLQVMDKALPPRRPIGPKVARNTLVGAVAGLMFGAIAALFLSAIQSRAAGH
jgi:uncharacterized protein involved in exopolysaccharide biosynthesis